MRSVGSEDSPRPVIPISKVLICLLAAVLGLAGAGSAAAGLRPDPPPKPRPPQAPASPQPPAASLPAQPQPPASPLPAQPQPAPPPAAGAPSADKTAASRLAAAARARAASARAAEARARAARLRDQRVKAAREAARNKQIAARRGLPGVPPGLSKPETPASATAVAFLFVSSGLAVLLLGLALIPARAVPWYWAARTLVDRRGELTFFGALGLFAAAFLLLAR